MRFMFTWMLVGVPGLGIEYLEFEVKVHILSLCDSNLTYSWLNSLYPSQHLSFLIILGVFEDASGELDTIDTVGLLIELEAFELK